MSIVAKRKSNRPQNLLLRKSRFRLTIPLGETTQLLQKNCHLQMSLRLKNHQQKSHRPMSHQLMNRLQKNYHPWILMQKSHQLRSL